MEFGTRFNLHVLNTMSDITLNEIHQSHFAINFSHISNHDWQLNSDKIFHWNENIRDAGILQPPGSICHQTTLHNSNDASEIKMIDNLIMIKYLTFHWNEKRVNSWNISLKLVPIDKIFNMHQCHCVMGLTDNPIKNHLSRILWNWRIAELVCRSTVITESKWPKLVHCYYETLRTTDME